MPFNQTLINSINAPVSGTSGSFILSPAGASGNSGGPAVDVWSDESFFDPTAYLSLYPTANGGNGGAGVAGNPGTNAIGTSASGPDDSSTLSFGNAGAGQPGGNGGSAGAATVDLESFIAGAVGTADNYVQITATADGGAASLSGANGGGGGNAGQNEADSGPPAFTENGGGPGDGAAGGAGGSGGAAVATINQLSDVTATGAFLSLVATGAAGGRGGISGGGGKGGSTSAGGVSGSGGFGGAATATLGSSSLTDATEVNVTLRAVGGAGGNGGQASAAGFSYSAGNADSPNNTITTTYGNNPSGGLGGNSGAASAVLTGNSLAAPSVFVTMTSISQAPGAGGAGTSQTTSSTISDGVTRDIGAGDPGATGASGQAGTESITFSNNVIAVTATAELGLNIGSTNTADPAAVPLDGAAGGNLEFSGNSFTGTGHSVFNVVFMGGGVTLDTVHGSVTINGSAANTMTGFTTFFLGDQDTAVLGAGGPYTVVVATDPDTVVLTPGHGNAIIDSATTTDLVLDFQGYGSAIGGLADILDDTTHSGGNTYISIPGDGTLELASNASWAPTSSDVTVACFRAGTRIATPDGDRAVEHLRAGDAVLSAFGGIVRVRWIGRRHLACISHPRPDQIRPVRIAADAFAPGQPLRDLYLSPDHAVFADNRLIPVKYLINGASIAQIPCADVTYYHVELPTHDVLLADGLPVESYLDTGNRAAFENGDAALTLHPDFAAALSLQTWNEFACAELLLHGPALTALRRRLIDRLPSIGHLVTADPALELLADDIVLAQLRCGGLLRATLPPATRRLRLLSRAAAPAQLDPASTDTRRLGVPVQSLRADGRLLPLDHPAFTAGWHKPEGGGGEDAAPGQRWTDGDATIDVTGVTRIELRLAPSCLRYHADAGLISTPKPGRVTQI